jgi:hypothetical protein
MSLALKYVCKDFILLLNMSTNTLSHTVRGEEIRTTNPRTLTSVLVCWPDPPTGRSDPARATSELARLIDEDMVVQNQMGVAINDKAPRINLGTCGANTINLRKEHARVKHYSCAKKTRYVRSKYSTRKKAQSGLHPINNDRMSRIISTLEAHHPISSLGKYVDDLSLTLIAPLGAYNHYA